MPEQKNKTLVKKASAEDLEFFVDIFRGSSIEYRLLCKYCRDIGKVSGSFHSMKNSRNLKKVAKKFAAQGWWIDDVPICSKCYYWKYQGVPHSR